jgi:hypothetical protein
MGWNSTERGDEMGEKTDWARLYEEVVASATARGRDVDLELERAARRWVAGEVVYVLSADGGIQYTDWRGEP